MTLSPPGTIPHAKLLYMPLSKGFICDQNNSRSAYLKVSVVADARDLAVKDSIPQGVSSPKRKYFDRTPMHINFKYRTFIRNKQCLKLLKRAIVNARSHELRIVQFSLQSNHIHLIVEAETNRILTRGMRSLTVTMAKGIKKGRVQLERYHLHVLRSVRETKNAVKYVVFNQQKHEKGTYSKVDEYSSLLSNLRGLEWAKDFARKTRMTLIIGKGESWIPDKQRSYLLKIGMAGLFCSS